MWCGLEVRSGQRFVAQTDRARAKIATCQDLQLMVAQKQSSVLELYSQSQLISS